ncbi:MAG: hypothetical protein M3Y71_15425 [Actinomycetota bacterium]|nr:hypothetical protein [Actinomycetota bacterium]
MRQGAVPLLVTHVVRLFVAVGAVAVETTMVVRGSRPDAELAGVLRPLGLGLAALTLPYLVVTVLALAAVPRPGRRGVALSTALAVVDVVVGVVAVAALVRLALAGGSPSGSLLVWGVAPLAPGGLTLLLTQTSPRPASHPPAP